MPKNMLETVLLLLSSWQVWSNYKLKKMSTTQCKQSYACASRLNDILACQNLYRGSQNVPQHAT